jgi:hypothetical protein
MKPLLLLLLICLKTICFAQSSHDSCGYTYKFKYLGDGCHIKTNDTVIIEGIANEDGTLTEPTVIKGVDSACKAGALRMVKEMMVIRNKCMLSYKYIGDSKRRIKIPIVFAGEED